MKAKRPYLSVVIPSYNEEDNIKRGVLDDIYKYLIKQKYTWEVIVSDDGSTDNGKMLVKNKIKKLNNFYLLENLHGGKPHALISGIRKAKGEHILFTDMDQSTPIDQLGKLIPVVNRGYDVAIGSRGLQRKNFPFYRRIGAIVFMSFRKAMLLPEIDDTQCGFKLFKADLVKVAFPKLEFFKSINRVKGWKVTSYDVELLHILKKMGAKINEVRVKWDDQDTSGSKGGTLKRYIKESWEMLTQIFRVKLNDIKKLYD